ncbi:MAG: hypothetical protein EXS63_01705 [Candidatus Omnitrophica bacterium]|nr:hypothetical protein [Candidatus Omnitrophota bacterium]
MHPSSLTPMDLSLLNNDIPPLLQMISSFSETEISRLTGGVSFRKGWDYLQTKRLEDFFWGEESISLCAKIRGTNLYQVTLTQNQKKDKIKGHCSCPAWNNGTNCKHVACALLGILQLIKPNFNQGNINLDYLEKMRVKIMSFPTPAATTQSGSPPLESQTKGLAIYLKKNQAGELTAECKKNNRRVNALRLENTHDFNSPYHQEASSTEATELALFDFLHQAQKDPFELYVETDQGVLRATWDPHLQIETELSLHLISEQNMEIRCVPSKDSKPLQNFYQLGRCLCLDSESGNLHFAEDLSALSYFYELKMKIKKDSFPDSDILDPKPQFQPIESIKLFTWEWNDLGIILSPNLFKKTTFYTQDIRQAPESQAPEFRLEIEQDVRSQNSYTVQTEWQINGKPLVAKYHPIRDLVKMVINHPELSSMYQSDRNRVYQAFLEFLNLPSPEEQTLFQTNFLNSLSFRYYERKEARTLFKILNDWRDPNLNPRQPLIKEGAWQIIEYDILRAFRLLGTTGFVLNHLPSLALLEKEERISVSAKKVLSILLDLKKSVEDLGGSLYWKKKEILVSSLEVSIDASVSNQDWFEIRPEIKLNGEPLNEKDWQNILDSTFLENQSGIHILDSNALAILTRLKKSLTSKPGTLNSREFIPIPRLEIFDLFSLRKLGARVRFSENDERILTNLMHLESIPPREIPAAFQGELRDYQKRGYDWLCFLYEHRFGACLADDMGLGKTVQALTLLAGLKEQKLRSPFPNSKTPHLIVVPPSLVFNWENEIRKFYPDLRVKLYTQPAANLSFSDCDIVLGTYDRVRLDIEVLKKIRFHVILFDEAQWIKNIFAARTSAVRQLKGNFKICLTGTPLENHVGEYYSVMDLCLPGLLGNPREFRSLAQEQNRALFLDRTRPFVLRRLKQTILKELPPKIETEVYLDLSEEQKQLYHKMVNEVRNEIAKAYSKKTESQARIIALTAILRLRQICVSSRLLNPDSKELSPKLEFMTHKLLELQDEGHACVVFSQFTRFLNLAEEALKNAKLDFIRMDGKTPIPKRKFLVENFQNPEGPPIFLVSLKTGGVGLNLTRASYVLHLDPWWNPAVDQQASDRVHRIGQTQTVFIHRILMRHTIEEKMMSLRQSKLELFKSILDEQSSTGPDLKITKADFDFLLT